MKQDLAARLSQVSQIPWKRTSDDGWHLQRGLRVRGKRELVAVLTEWISGSSAATIGEVGSYGGKPWLVVEIHGREIVLNADTTRAAVERFVRAPDPERSWRVVATRSGRPVKVLPGPDAEPAPGWYAYLTGPGRAGELI